LKPEEGVESLKKGGRREKKKKKKHPLVK